MSSCVKCGIQLSGTVVGASCAACAQITRHAAMTVVPTLRQRYAMAALPVLIASAQAAPQVTRQEVVAQAWSYADAMLAAERAATKAEEGTDGMGR